MVGVVVSHEDAMSEIGNKKLKNIISDVGVWVRGDVVGDDSNFSKGGNGDGDGCGVLQKKIG